MTRDRQHFVERESFGGLPDKLDVRDRRRIE
jgi:hypothetical protein